MHSTHQEIVRLGNRLQQSKPLTSSWWETTKKFTTFTERRHAQGKVVSHYGVVAMLEAFQLKVAPRKRLPKTRPKVGHQKVILTDQLIYAKLTSPVDYM